MSDIKPLTAAGTLARLITGARSETQKNAKKCPVDKRMHSLAEGKSHPLWLLGHLGNTAEFIGNTIAFGKPSGAWPKEWTKRFSPSEFGGDKISTNPADYPSWDELAAAYEKTMDALAASAATLTDAELLAPPKGGVPPPLQAYMKTMQDALTLIIVHDSHHRGQLALLAAAPK